MLATIISIIKNSLDYAIKCNRLNINPCRDLCVPNKQCKSITAYSEVQQRLLEKCLVEDKKSNQLSVRWNGRDLLNTISEMMGWDLSSESYKVLGTHLIEESAMLFELDSAEEIN